MHNPYLALKAIVQNIQVDRSRFGVMFSSAITSVVALPILIISGLYTTGVKLNSRAYLRVATMVMTLSIINAGEIALFRKINIYVAAIACSLTTLILTVVISYVLGSRN